MYIVHIVHCTIKCKCIQIKRIHNIEYDDIFKFITLKYRNYKNTI